MDSDGRNMYYGESQKWLHILREFLDHNFVSGLRTVKPKNL